MCHRYAPPPNHTESPETANVLPVMAPGRGHAPTRVHPFQPSGLRYSRSPATAYADAAIA